MGATDGQVEKRKPGGQQGNRNRLRHGLYSPSMGKGLSYPDKQAGIFRRAIENALIELRGEVGLLDAALVHSATEAQKVAFANRAAKRAAEEAGALKAELALAFDRDYLKALDVRDRKLLQLGLNQREADPWDSLYSSYSDPIPVSSPADEPQAAQDATPDAHDEAQAMAEAPPAAQADPSNGLSGESQPLHARPLDEVGER